MAIILILIILILSNNSDISMDTGTGTGLDNYSQYRTAATSGGSPRANIDLSQPNTNTSHEYESELHVTQ